MKKILRLTTTIIVLLFLGGNAWGQIISQYVETNSGSIPKGIEIWNNTASALDFSANSLIIQQGTNGGALADLSGTLITSGTLASNAVLVIGTSDIGTYLTDQGHTSVTFVDYGFSFNGNDALAVKYGGSVTDIFGLAGNDPGSAWTGNDVSTANQNIQLVSGITAGDTDGWTDPSTRFETICTDNCLTGFGVAPSAGATPSISVFPSTLTGFTYIEGSGPSAEQSFTVEGSNLTHDISIAATTNYQISTGTGGSFSATTPITLTQSGGSVATTTIYVRLKAGLGAGSYNSEVITASSTGATDKTVTCSGSVTPIPAPGYLVDFEGTGETKGSYASGTVNLSGLDWDLTEALIGSEASDWKNGTRSARMRGYAASAMTMLADKSNGVGTVSFNYRRYVTDAQVDWKVEYTTNAGSNWTQIGSDFTAPDSDDVQLFSEVVDVAGNIRIRIKRATETGSANNRLNIDDISITDYSSGVSVPIVTTPTATSITDVSATLGGNITSDGGSSITERGTVWKTSAGVTITDNKLAEGGTSTGVFSHSRTSLPAGSQIFYRAYATNAIGTTLSDESSFYTLAAEPSSHPTGFGATANSSSTITVNWTDAVPAVDGYLIKGSNDSYGDIAVPVDGTAETNSLLVQNVTSGVQTFQFTGLAASTTYYFKIYPYNGSAAAINYKTDGTIQQADAKTLDPDAVKWDGGASTTAWTDANNWTNDAVPTATDVVLLDNSSVAGSYEVILPSGNVQTTIKRLTISPSDPSTITLRLPVGNTYGVSNEAGFVVGDNTASTDDIIINSGGILVNASGATIGNGIQVNSLANGTFRINDGGKYLHNTSRSTGGTAEASILSSVAGTEYGIYEFDVPGTSSFSIPASGRTFGSLVLTRTDGPANYNSSGGSQLTIKGDFLLNTDVTYSTTMTGELVVERDLTISASSSFVIGVNSKSSINGILTNNAGPSGILLKSDATGTGSLIHNTASVPATIERYVTAATWATASDGWHLLSSPVASQSISGDWTPTGTGGDYDLYVFDETKLYEYWLNQKVGENNITTFEKGKGYLAAYEQSATKAFAGNVNVADVPLSGLTNTGTSAFPGWHLVGNPFASAINWGSSTWTKTNINAVAQVWSSTDGSYKTTTEKSDIIPSMNGFMVHTTGSGSITIPANARVHNSANWYKSDEDFILLKANDLETTMSQSSIVRFNPAATEAYDSDFDSYFLSGFAPMFYSVSGSDMYALNTLPEISNSMVIPFGFVKNNSVNYNIELAKNIPGTQVYLTDKKTDIVTNLTESPVYSFTSSEGDDPNRFELKFGAVGIDDNVALEQTSIYSHGQSVYISSTKSANALINIYNVTGQQVYANTMVIDGQKQIALNTPTGWYIVKVTTAAGVATQKVFIKSN